MDQFSTEKLWHSSNVMGFDVDAELHYRTPLKPVKPLFICLLPMQRRTLAGNVPHSCYAPFSISSSSSSSSSSPSFPCIEEARLVARTHTYTCTSSSAFFANLCSFWAAAWEMTASSQLASDDCLSPSPPETHFWPHSWHQHARL